VISEKELDEIIKNGGHNIDRFKFTAGFRAAEKIYLERIEKIVDMNVLIIKKNKQSAESAFQDIEMIYDIGDRSAKRMASIARGWLSQHEEAP
jgi:hypothetical protein